MHISVMRSTQTTSLEADCVQTVKKIDCAQSRAYRALILRKILQVSCGYLVVWQLAKPQDNPGGCHFHRSDANFEDREGYH